MGGSMSEVALRTGTQVAVSEELTIEQLIAQVTKIQQAMSSVMRQNEHYGVIPGTDKPTLYKPGAEKLCLLFRLDPQYEIVSEDVSDMQIRYVVNCTLYHIPTGNRIASGMGSCSTREKKYRWRMEPTGENPPDKPTQEQMKAQGTGGFRKIKGNWAWCVRVEADPYDNENTVLKMACKRALVAAVLNGTAASDIFTQDLEDLEEHRPVAPVETLGDDKLALLVSAIDAASSLDSKLWSPEVVIANATRKFSRRIEKLSDLTDAEADQIVHGIETWFQNEQAKAMEGDEEVIEILEGVVAEEIPFGEDAA